MFRRDDTKSSPVEIGRCDLVHLDTLILGPSCKELMLRRRLEHYYFWSKYVMLCMSILVMSREQASKQTATIMGLLVDALPRLTRLFFHSSGLSIRREEGRRRVEYEVRRRGQK